MINDHIDEYGKTVELQKKVVTSSNWQGDVFNWTKDKDVKGVLRMATGKEVESLEKRSIRATHKLYLKLGDISASDVGKRFVFATRRLYITYIDNKMPSYDETVNHIRVFVEERENE